MSNVDREIAEALKDLCDTKYQIGYGDGLKKGREQGYKEGLGMRAYNKSYEDGLSDAWSAITKLESMSSDSRYEMFDKQELPFHKILAEYSPAQLLAKIETYEKRHFKVGTKVRTIKSEDCYGTELFTVGTVGTIVEIISNDTWPYLVESGSCRFLYSADMLEVIEEETFEVGDIVERTSAGTYFKAVIVNVERTPKGSTYITLMFSDGSSDKEKLGDIPWTKTGEHVDLSNMLNMLSTKEN